MKKLNKKILLLSILGLICTEAMGCGKKSAVEEVLKVDVFQENDEILGDYIYDEIYDICVKENPIEEIEPENERDISNVFSYSVVEATENVKIRDKDGNLMGVLPKHRYLKLIEATEDGKYKVDYYGDEAFVSCDYTVESSRYDIDAPLLKVVYATEDTNFLVPAELSTSGEEEFVPVSKLEPLEVYGETIDFYLVKTKEHVGFALKMHLEELMGTFVTVNIKDQELTLYSENETILKVPVITGLPTESRKSDEGLFEIYNISKPRYLLDENGNENVFVDTMIKYNGNEGLHDAEYHSHNDGFRHGWKATSDFGGETYLTNGSHGCINMRHDDVMEVKEYVEYGSKVLVYEKKEVEE